MKRPSSWQAAIAAWCVWLRAADRPRSTIRLRTHQLLRYAEHTRRGPWTTTTADLAAWVAQPGWATETRRSNRSALVVFYDWAVTAGHIATNPARALPTIPAPKHLARPTPESVLADALRYADDRTRLMLLLGSRQGLRRGEIAAIHSDDLAQTFTGHSLRVVGKGRKVRLVPLLPEVATLLRMRGEGYAFPGKIDGHLSPDTVGVLIARALPDHWTAHTLRHRFATKVYAGSRDLLSLQELLGHSRAETTRGYVQLPDEGLRAALDHAA